MLLSPELRKGTELLIPKTKVRAAHGNGFIFDCFVFERAGPPKGVIIIPQSPLISTRKPLQPGVVGYKISPTGQMASIEHTIASPLARLWSDA